MEAQNAHHWSTVTIIRLWCLVLGSSSAFYVTIGRDNFIIDLKEAIKNKKQNVFASVDVDQLVLWKLKNPVNDELIDDIQDLALQDNENDENVDLLKDMWKIVNY